MFPRTIGEHNSLGICVSQVGGPHNTRDMCFLGRETHISMKTKHISLGICVSKVGEQISPGICISQVGE